MKTTAKKAVERSVASYLELTRQLIETRIESKITGGDFQCEIVFFIPDKIMKELKSKKYVVASKGKGSLKHHIISWRHLAV